MKYLKYLHVAGRMLVRDGSVRRRQRKCARRRRARFRCPDVIDQWPMMIGHSAAVIVRQSVAPLHHDQIAHADAVGIAVVVTVVVGVVIAIAAATATVALNRVEIWTGTATSAATSAATAAAVAAALRLIGHGFVVGAVVGLRWRA